MASQVPSSMPYVFLKTYLMPHMLLQPPSQRLLSQLPFPYNFISPLFSTSLSPEKCLLSLHVLQIFEKLNNLAKFVKSERWRKYSSKNNASPQSKYCLFSPGCWWYDFVKKSHQNLVCIFPLTLLKFAFPQNDELHSAVDIQQRKFQPKSKSGK